MDLQRTHEQKLISLSSTGKEYTQQTQTANVVHSPQLITPAQQGVISSSLLGLIYFVLPVAFCLTIWLHDRNTRSQRAKLVSRMALLERIWKQKTQI